MKLAEVLSIEPGIGPKLIVSTFGVLLAAMVGYTCNADASRTEIRERVGISEAVIRRIEDRLSRLDDKMERLLRREGL